MTSFGALTLLSAILNLAMPDVPRPTSRIPFPLVPLIVLFVTVSVRSGVHALPAPDTPLPPAMPLPPPLVWLAVMTVWSTVPVIVEKPLLPMSITVRVLLLPSAPGAVPPSAAVLPLPEMIKLVWVREALFPPAFEMMLALVPVGASEMLLFVIAMTSALLPGIPAVAPGPVVVELPMSN